MADNLKDLEGMQVALKEFRQIGKRNREVLLGMLTKEHETLGDKLEDPYVDLRNAYRNGAKSFDQKIVFIKEVRNRSKDLPGVVALGLKESKDLVESW